MRMHGFRTVVAPGGPIRGYYSPSQLVRQLGICTGPVTGGDVRLTLPCRNDIRNYGRSLGCAKGPPDSVGIGRIEEEKAGECEAGLELVVGAGERPAQARLQSRQACGDAAVMHVERRSSLSQ